MATILVFNRRFTQLSETFIYRQLDCLRKNYSIELLAYTYENEELFPLRQISKNRLSIYVNLFDKGISILLRRIFRLSLRLSLFNSIFLNRILKTRRIKAVHAHYGPNAIKLLDVVKRAQVPLVVSFHGFDASKALKKDDYVQELPALFDYASAVLVCSSHMIDSLSLRRYESKIHVVPYGIDPHEFLPGRESTGKVGQIRIVHSGRLVAKKGVPDLIAVFGELLHNFDNIELHILGDGPERRVCEQLVSELNIAARVKFYGAQAQTAVKELLATADVFVLNSRVASNGDMEGLPNSILEAMSMEKAVVSTRHAGIPDVIKSGINGILVTEKSNEELKDALARLIRDERLRLQLGREARRTILDSFSIDVMHKRLTGIFDEIVCMPGNKSKAG